MLPIEHKFSRILLTNDDGIDAPGLDVLGEIAKEFAEEIWIVAPVRDRSGASQSVSLHESLRLTQYADRKFGLDGTPSDCVVVALRHLMKSAAPDLVLSGINRGANLGHETIYSGTVGAAMTSLLLGISSIALSQTYRDSTNVRWRTADSLARRVIPVVSPLLVQERVCLNVNFPDVAPQDAGPIVATHQDAGILQDIDVLSRTDENGESFFSLQMKRGRQESADSETKIVNSGCISVTPIHFNRTSERAKTQLELLLSAQKEAL
ncbi:5'/3'-nucleotidase SurE [Herbaspirillum robiniae]|uniref:5'/3'-nucleotidase SurE n=1 Tax=Herbaspirillum robiniae TaxID=2014887 RepID=UPI003D780C0A